MSEFREEEMLACLDQTPPDLTPILAPLSVLFEEDPDTAESHAKLIRLTLVEQKANTELIRFFMVLSDWYSTDREWRKTVQRELERAFEGDELLKMFLDLSGMDSPRLKAKEALRRLKLLSELTEGDYVYMKNFGFGKVLEVRHADKKVKVDFETRPGHELGLGFAAEKLERISEDHLYARKNLAPEALETLIKENPAEVVRVALRSFGSTAAPQLQKLIVPAILPDAKWKTFWANARKDLKKDPLVVIPTKRSEPIELLEQEKSYDDTWFRDLADNKNMPSILAVIEEYLEAESEPALDDKARAIVVDRLKFVTIGAEGNDDGLIVRSWLIAEQLNITPDEIQLTSFLLRIRTPEGLLKTVQSLSASLAKAFLAALSNADAEVAADVLLKVLPDLEYSALNEGIQLLTDLELEDKVATALRPVWNQWTAEVDVMFWLSQNPKKITEWNYGGTPDLVARVLKVINRDYTGNRLRVRNQLREVFRKPAWLKEVLGSMDERQRRALTQGVKDSTAWEQLDKASVLGQIVKIDPSVQDIVSGKGDEQEKAAPVEARVSSVRSFRVKEAQLQKIIEKDIPENSREIAVARSYGDLRENFEYKAAKDTQKLLMGRRAELEVQLREVKPTDFGEFTSEVAGIATTVTIRNSAGTESTYHIGGEWDSDIDRSILSNASGMAKAIRGSKAGDKVEVPSESGPEEVEVVQVVALDEAVKEWLSSEDIETT